jgi:hypothetical protein
MKKNFGLLSNELLVKFRNKIYDIVAQVRDKINKDSKEQGLITTVPKVIPEENGSATQPPATATAPPSTISATEIIRNNKTYILHVTKYADERAGAKYDEILSAIGEYFELFKTHTDLLEDLWLQLLGFLNL